MESFQKLQIDIQNHIINKIIYSQPEELLNEIKNFPKHKFLLYLQYAVIEDYISILYHFYKIDKNILEEYIFNFNIVDFKIIVLQIYNIWISQNLYKIELEDIYFDIISTCLNLYNIKDYHDYIWTILQKYLHFEPNIYEELDCEINKKWSKSIKSKYFTPICR